MASPLGLSMLVNPLHWGILVLLVVAICSPRFFPTVARFAGKLVGMEIRRRLGISALPKGPTRRPEQHYQPEPEEFAPDIYDPSPEEPRTRQAPIETPPQNSLKPLLPIIILVFGAAVVLLWFLLQSR